MKSDSPWMVPAPRLRHYGRMLRSLYLGGKKLDIKADPTRIPGPGEVMLEVAYCGVCGTDLHIFHGAMDARVAPPQTIGHEASAVVAAVGDGVRGFSVGDPVVVRSLDARGEKPADRGFSHICRGMKFLGIDSPGALQRSWIVPAFTLQKVPPGVDLQTADFAGPVVFLASAASDYMHGSALVVDGGWLGR